MRTTCHKYLYPLIWGLVISCGFFACSKIDATYSDFLQGGEKIYTGKADSLKAYPGRNRIRLSWILLPGPHIDTCKIYWNNRQDSVEVDVKDIAAPAPVSVMVGNIAEGAYTFEVFTYGASGRSSVSSEVVASVYGDLYQASLLSQAIKDTLVKDDTLVLAWQDGDKDVIGNQITYTDAGGAEQNLFFPAHADTTAKNDTTRLALFPAGGTFRYRTLYLPDSLAIDTFYTAYETVTVDAKMFEAELDKSGFSLYPLPGDYDEPNAATSTVDKIWTNADAITDVNTYISLVNGHAMPQWFTIDLGGAYALTKMKLFQRGNTESGAVRLYAGGNVMEFEVWGSLNPDPDYNPDDHGGDFDDSWVLLQSCKVERPSGNTIASGATRSDNTAEDIAAAEAGHEFSFNDAGKVRYLRIKVLKNWDAAGRGFVNIAALAIWTN
ncbi:DUF4998 domain-containing protein [Compostibacter hankyongensis]|uniref:DUF4998 domain-containing protein n=1 Tax=Compostibacter hankyongensis TaxID=1007089 RepID=A0ABP8FVR5_9BACT